MGENIQKSTHHASNKDLKHLHRLPSQGVTHPKDNDDVKGSDQNPMPEFQLWEKHAECNRRSQKLSEVRGDNGNLC